MFALNALLAKVHSLQTDRKLKFTFGVGFHFEAVLVTTKEFVSFSLPLGKTLISVI